MIRCLGAALVAAYVYTLGPGMGVSLDRLEWRVKAGGLSGLDLAPDGRRVVAISDNGVLYYGTLERDSTGRLSGITADRNILGDPRGQPLMANGADAEDVALSDGRILVSYEQVARIWTHNPDGTKGPTIPYATDFHSLTGNLGLEALAVAPDGTVVTIAERLLSPAPVWVFDGTAWAAAAPIRTRPLYAVTAADFGPDGRLYLLERAFLGVSFAARLRRIDWPGRTAETLVTLPLGRVGNAEGLAVTQVPEGLRLTVITDDNDLPAIQRSEIIEILLRQ